jgi:hypothetical protein
LDLAAFREDGALLLGGIFNTEQVDELRGLASNGPGARLSYPELPTLIAPATAAADELLGLPARPVRAVLFDKTADANWAVAWHQDRVIAVKERREVEGFGLWSRKGGAIHVTPPLDVLEQMVTLRIHLDPCGADNAPLRVALGSHRLGRVPADRTAAIAAGHRQCDCLAQTGDVWAYATLILHTSARAAAPSRRRVLQVDYAALDLPGGLEWAGVEAQTPH